MEEVEESCENVTETTETEQKNIDFEYYGEYLSTQFEVLERTLSHLKVNDLISASFVNKSWQQVSQRLLKKREKLRWHIRCKLNIIGHNFKNKIDFQSEFVLGFQMSRFKGSKDQLLNELMEDDSYICSSNGIDVSKGRNIPGLRDANMLLIRACKSTRVPYYTNVKRLRYFDDVEVGIFFPKMEGLRIVTIPLKINNFDFDFDPTSLKGILTFNRTGNFKVTEQAFSKLINTSQTPVALAGGIFNDVKTFNKDENLLKQHTGLLNICFYGENVSCHSDVLDVLVFDRKRESKREAEKFMNKMKEELGPFDAKRQRRIAIVIRCIARDNTQYENHLFEKYFPDVPAFTVLSNGECGFRTVKSEIDEASERKKGRKNIKITFCYSVVYFFVTLNLSA